MFVRDGSAGLALYPYVAGPMRRLRLGATPDAPPAMDQASIETWVRAVYQEILTRPPTPDELVEGVRIVTSGQMIGPYQPAWYLKNVLSQVKTGYLVRLGAVGAATWVKPSNNEQVGPLPLGPAVQPLASAPPPSTTAPATSPTPAAAATVAQVTLPSGPVPQSTQFQVDVVVQNSGGTVWDSGYTVQMVAPTGAPTANPVSFANLPPLSPGQSAKVTLTVWAPSAPGTYAYQFAVLNPAQQPVAPVGTVAVSVVTPAAAAPTQVVQTATDAVGRQEFDSFVAASLQNVDNVQHAVDALTQANIRGYQPTYTSIPGAPTPGPGQPVIVPAAVIPEGPNWWLWGLGLTALGLGAWWYFGKKKTGRRRIAETKTVTTRTTGRRRL